MTFEKNFVESNLVRESELLLLLLSQDHRWGKLKQKLKDEEIRRRAKLLPAEQDTIS